MLFHLRVENTDMQGANQHIMSDFWGSVSRPRARRPGDPNQQPSDNKTLSPPLSHSQCLWSHGGSCYIRLQGEDLSETNAQIILALCVLEFAGILLVHPKKLIHHQNL